MSNEIKPKRKRRLSTSDDASISRPVTPSNVQRQGHGRETPSSGSSTIERFNLELSTKRLALLRQTIRNADVTPIVAQDRPPSLIELEEKLSAIAGATSTLYERERDSSGCQTPEMDAETKLNADAKVKDWLRSTVSHKIEGPPSDGASSPSTDVASLSDQANKQSESCETD